MAESVPVVSLGHSDALVRALSTTGFAAVRDHGVPDADLVAMRRLLVDLFAVDEETQKGEFDRKRNSLFGSGPWFWRDICGIENVRENDNYFPKCV